MPHPVTNSNSKMTMLANPPIFPTHLPAGYECFADETTYDPDQHLALEWPEQSLKRHKPLRKRTSREEFSHSSRNIKHPLNGLGRNPTDLDLCRFSIAHL